MALMTIHKVTSLPTAPYVTDALYLLLRDGNKAELYISDSTGAKLIPLVLASNVDYSPLMFLGGDNAS
jgi:hypothetical protein